MKDVVVLISRNALRCVGISISKKKIEIFRIFSLTIYFFV